MTIATDPVGDWADGDELAPEDINSRFNTLYDAVNGNLGGANVSGSDPIPESKLSLTAATGSHASRHGTGGSDAIPSGGIALGMLKGATHQVSDPSDNVDVPDFPDISISTGTATP